MCCMYNRFLLIQCRTPECTNALQESRKSVRCRDIDDQTNTESDQVVVTHTAFQNRKDSIDGHGSMDGETAALSMEHDNMRIE